MNAVEQLEQENEALRALVSDYQALMAEIVVHVPVGAKRVGRIDALMERAKVLLREEQQR